MTSREILHPVQKLLSVLQPTNYLLEFLGWGSSKFLKAIELQAVSLEKTIQQDIIGAQHDVDAHLSTFCSEVRKYSPRQIFHEVERLEKAITPFGNELHAAHSNEVAQLLTASKQFSDSYEHFIATYSSPNAYKTLRAIYNFDARISSLISTLSLLNISLQNTQALSGMEGERMSLFLSAHITFQAFVAKLVSIEVIYKELCDLLQVSLSQEPLRIVKVESGSTWIDVAGNPTVLQLVMTLITCAAGYMYRQFSSEGKLTGMPKKVDVAASILNLSNELKQRGVDTREIEEHITKATVTIAKQLNDLLENEDKIEINGEALAITPSGRPILEGRAPILNLEHSTSDAAASDLNS